MKQKKLKWFIVVEICLLAVLIGAVIFLSSRRDDSLKADPTAPTDLTTAPATTVTTSPTTVPATETTAAPTTLPVTEPATEETTVPEPVPEHYWLSFAGDCTLGTMYRVYSAASSFSRTDGGKESS
mgnify:CR=1 FL=1